MPAAHRAKLPGYGRFFDAPNRMIEIIFAGVFDRFPELDVVFAEVDFGWVPYVKEQIDNNYQRLEPVSHFGLQMLPSEYVDRHFHFGYMTDTFGLQQRHYVGAERILWSSDYPHISADWPNSWRTIQASFSGISPAERRLILAANAQRLYNFGVSLAQRRCDPAGAPLAVSGGRVVGRLDPGRPGGVTRRVIPVAGGRDRRRRPLLLRPAGVATPRRWPRAWPIGGSPPVRWCRSSCPTATRRSWRPSPPSRSGQ